MKYPNYSLQDSLCGLGFNLVYICFSGERREVLLDFFGDDSNGDLKGFLGEISTGHVLCALSHCDTLQDVLCDTKENFRWFKAHTLPGKLKAMTTCLIDEQDTLFVAIEDQTIRRYIYENETLVEQRKFSVAGIDLLTAVMPIGILLMAKWDNDGHKVIGLDIEKKYEKDCELNFFDLTSGHDIRCWCSSFHNKLTLWDQKKESLLQFDFVTVI